MLVLAAIGVLSYRSLGQSEDPPFTFKAMVVRTVWPGATAEEVSRQVTERVEKALMTTGKYEFIRSYSRPGESQVIFVARDSMRSSEIPELWYQVRKKVGDIEPTLPEGTVGPFFNDEFGDTFGNIYALTGKGFDYAVLKDYAERVELELQRVPDVGKVELIGLQDEKIWIELSNTKLATFGIPLSAVQQALSEQNAIEPAGFFETGSDRVQLRVTGAFRSVDAIRQFPIRAGDRTVRVGDVASVHAGFADPAAPRMRFMGDDAIGIAVAMKDGGDILRLGDTLQKEFARLQGRCRRHGAAQGVRPAARGTRIGRRVHARARRGGGDRAAGEFLLAGIPHRPGGRGDDPLVLAMTFAVMHYFHIGLHKISLGALVLALGLLVDDAIIAVEMMAIKMEQGFSRLKAASFAWETTAFPMLTGTLVTAAGFLPIATAASSTGEYTRSLFQVVTIALVVSWIAAVLFIPYLGDRMLPDLHSEARQAHDPHARRSTALPRAARLVPGASQVVIAMTVGGVRRVDPVVPLRAATVLPGFDAARADGRHGTRRRLVAEATESQASAWKRCCASARRRQLRRVRRHRFAAFLSAARPATARGELLAVRRAHARFEAREDVRTG
jgi:multidrug efflux pump